MIIQNLFNNKPKTFMDYEPGKVPRKEEWDKQTTTQNQPQNSFLSNVKLVGDDMTERDYDTFFEGFRSTNDKPLWQEPKLWQTPKVPTLTKRSLIDAEPKRKTISYNPVFGSGTRKPAFPNLPSYGGGAKIQTSPYRPSTTNEANIEFLPHRPSTTNEANIQFLPGRPSIEGEVKFQPLPYIPEKDGGTGLIKYASTAPQNVQVRNASQKSEETWWDKAWGGIKKPLVALDDSVDELARMYGDLSPEIKSAIEIVLNPWSDRDSREAANKFLENEVMRMHYGRNQYNVDFPKNKKDVDDWKWEEKASNCHQFTADKEEKERHIKYVSPDGKREVIFDSDWNVVTADEDEGTYNYADPDLWLAHFVVDILPWLRYGNTPEDTTEWYERIGGLFNFG